MGALRVVIPGEMRGKGRPRFGSGRAYTDRKTAGAERTIGWYARQAGARPVSYPVRVRVLIVVAIPASWSKTAKASALAGGLLPTGKPDIDNAIKLLLDALNKIAWDDDKQVVALECRKIYGAEPHTVIEVWPA